MILLTILRRLLRLGVVLTAAVVLTFALVHLVPGDPARSIAGPQADQATVDACLTGTEGHQRLHLSLVPDWLGSPMYLFLQITG